MATSFIKDNIHLIVIVLDCKNVQNRYDDSVKLTFWGYNRLNAILDHFKKNNSGSRTDDTTASTGQSSNSQKNKIGKNKIATKKMIKNRSRRLTTEKRNRTQDSQKEIMQDEEEKKLSSEHNTSPEEIEANRVVQKLSLIHI